MTYRGRFIVCRGARRIERTSMYPSRKRRTGKGSGMGTKGCFNSLLSNVAQQEEEKATPPVRNYLADLRRTNVYKRGRESADGETGRSGVR